jgi:hypothetical protein
VNRALSFGLAALQALIVLSSAVGSALVPLTLAWLIEGNGSVDWIVTLQVAGYAFLLALGVQLQIGAGEIVGIPFESFAISFLPLGLTLLMALLVIVCRPPHHFGRLGWAVLRHLEWLHMD